MNTTKDRVSDYDAIRPDLAAHPLIGRGYGSYDQKKHRILDNQYLTLAIGVGLLGLVAYLAIFVTAFLSAHRVARSSDPSARPPALAAAAAIVVRAGRRRHARLPRLPPAPLPLLLHRRDRHRPGQGRNWQKPPDLEGSAENRSGRP